MIGRVLEILAVVVVLSGCTAKGGGGEKAPPPAPAKAAAEGAPAKPAAAAANAGAAPAKPASAKPAKAKPAAVVVNFKATAKHPVKAPAKVPAKRAARRPAKAEAKPQAKAEAPATAEAPAPSPAMIAAGKKIWARHCHLCHRDGTRTEFMHHRMPDLTRPAFQKAVTDAELTRRITDGYGEKKPDGKTPMPAFAHKLSANDVQAVVAYVRSLRR